MNERTEQEKPENEDRLTPAWPGAQGVEGEDDVEELTLGREPARAPAPPEPARSPIADAADDAENFAEGVEAGVLPGDPGTARRAANDLHRRARSVGAMAVADAPSQSPLERWTRAEHLAKAELLVAKDYLKAIEAQDGDQELIDASRESLGKATRAWRHAHKMKGQVERRAAKTPRKAPGSPAKAIKGPQAPKAAQKPKEGRPRAHGKGSKKAATAASGPMPNASQVAVITLGGLKIGESDMERAQREGDPVARFMSGGMAASVAVSKVLEHPHKSLRAQDYMKGAGTTDKKAVAKSGKAVRGIQKAVADKTVSGAKVGTLGAIADVLLFEGGHTIKEIAMELARKASPAMIKGRDLQANVRARMVHYRRRGDKVVRDEQTGHVKVTLKAGRK